MPITFVIKKIFLIFAKKLINYMSKTRLNLNPGCKSTNKF